jgi:hypothetical protein
MNDQRDRIILLVIYEQDNHLAITFVGPMVGTGTIRMRCPGDL